MSRNRTPNTNFIFSRFLIMLDFLFVYRFGFASVLLLSVANIALGQNLQVTNAPLAPSPTVSTILKSVDMPVSYYTGTPDISIPLFQLSGTDLNLPINLVFNSNGFKVDEIPGWVGAGWTLSTSGAIGRNIVDAPDNFAFGYSNVSMDQYYYNGGNLPNLNACAGVINLNSDAYRFYTFLNSGVGGQPTWYDTEPDIYSYSLPAGESGKFLVKRDRQIQAMPRTRTQIGMLSTGAGLNDYSFNIRDERGSSYSFAFPETINSLTLSSTYTMNGISRLGDFAPITSWNIATIRSARTPELIQFAYTPETTIYDTPVSESKGFLRVPTFASDPTGIAWDQVTYTSHTHNIASTQRLSNITFGDYTVNFIADAAERSDLSGGHRLKQVVIMCGSDTIKSFRLFHSYVGSPVLRLDSLVEYGRGGVRLPAYVFEYHTTLTPPTLYSMNKDHWGYYNGENNLTTLPTYQRPNDPYPINFIGGNREPSLDYCKWGMPKKITYPTGGRMEYEYELNTFSRFGIEYQKTLTEASVFINPSNSGNTQVGSDFVNDAYFTVSDTTYAWVHSIVNCDDPGNGIPADCGIELRGVGNNYYQYIAAGSELSFLKLLPGNYNLHARIKTTRPNIIASTVRWWAKGNLLTEKAGPGVRVKTIKGYDGINLTPVISKQLNYVQANNVSSGLLHDLLRYDYDYRATNNNTLWPLNQACFNDNPYTIRVLQNSNLNSFTSGGTLLGYDRVEEVQLAGGGAVTLDALQPPPTVGTPLNGKIVHEFYNEFSPTYIPDPSAGQPNTPQTASIGLSGKKKREKYYNDAGILMKESYYTYQQSNPSSVYGWQAVPRTNENCKKCDFVFGQYVYQGIAYESDTTIETEYYNGIAFVKKTIEDNEFKTDISGHDSFYIKRKQQILDSKGYSKSSEFKYSFDFNNQPTAVQTSLNNLTGLNMLSPIYQVSVNSKDNTIVSGRLLNFEPWPGYAFGMRLKQYYDIEIQSPTPYSLINPGSDITNPAAPFVLKSTFTYDNASYQLTGINKVNDVPQAFLWSPGNSPLLVAEAKNAASGQIYYDGFEYSGGTLDNNAKTGKKSRPSNYTFTPSGIAVVPNSTLSYWYYSGNTWIYKALPYSGGSITINDGIKIDELRIFPKDAIMTTYSHWQGVGAITITDPNNFLKTFDYDGFNRLIATKDNEGNVIQRYKYVYSINQRSTQ